MKKSMASKQLVQHAPSHLSKNSETLAWCLKNFTQDFFAETLWHEDRRKYNEFISVTSTFPFLLKSWIKSQSKVDQRSFSFFERLLSSPYNNSISRKSRHTILSRNVTYLPLQPIPKFAFYSTTTKTDINDDDLNNLPTKATLIDRVASIIEKDKEFTQVLEFEDLLGKILDSDSTNILSELFQIRGPVYKYLIMSKSLLRLQLIEKIILINHLKPMTKQDFDARLNCIIDLHPGLIEETLLESIKLFSHKTVLGFLYTTILQLRKKPDESLAPEITDKSLFLFQLYYSIILKQLGTLRLLDTDKYKIERRILANMLHNEKPKIVLRILKQLLTTNPAFSHMFATTIIDISYRTHNFSFVTEVWLIKENQKMASTYDLFKTMSSFIQLKQPDNALNIYQQNPDLHADWLFAIVLKTYAIKQDWVGMQRVFESLFDRKGLPNVEHYRIVMDAISKMAGIEIVELMYKNMLSLGLQPTVHIYNALLFSYYAFGDVNGLKRLFKELEESEIRPNMHSYNILLMMYRDTKDLDSAREVLRTIIEKKFPVERSLLTTIISLCAERKDPINGEAVFHWIKEAGHYPDITSYNALLTCYVKSRFKTETVALFAEMKKKRIPLRIDTLTIMLSYYAQVKDIDGIDNLMNEMMEKNIIPDAKFYSVLLDYFCNSNQIEAAEELIESMKQSPQNPGPSIYHLSILMGGYLRKKRFSDVIKVYNSLQDYNIQPTFHTSALFLTALQRSGKRNYKLKDRAASLLSEFLSDTESLDLTSDYTPRNVVPPQLVKVVMRRYADAGNPQKVLEIMNEMSKQNAEYAAIDHVIVLRKLLEAAGRSADWELFNQYWDEFIKAERKTYVPREVKHKNTKKIIDQIPLPDSFSNNKVFRYKIFQLVTFGQYSQIIPFIHMVEGEGFRLSNKLLNEIVRLLVESDQTVFDGFMIAHKYLEEFELKRKQLRPLYMNQQLDLKDYQARIGQFNIQRETKSSLSKNLYRLVNLVMMNEGYTSEIDALRKLNNELGHTIRKVYELTAKKQFPYKDIKEKNKE